MKRFLFAILTVLPLSAQVPCVLSGSFTATGTSAQIDNRKIGCYQWRVAYNNFGFSALSIQLEQAPDAGGVPGAWAAFTGASVVTDGANPSTNTNAAIIGIHSAAAWVRFKLVSKTGSGTIFFQVWGANSTSNIAGLSGLTLTGTSPIVAAGLNVSCPSCTVFTEFTMKNQTGSISSFPVMTPAADSFFFVTIGVEIVATDNVGTLTFNGSYTNAASRAQTLPTSTVQVSTGVDSKVNEGPLILKAGTPLNFAFTATGLTGTTYNIYVGMLNLGPA